MSAAAVPQAHDMFIAPIDLRKPKNMTGPTKDRPVLNFQWLDNSELATLFANGFHGELESVGGPGRKLVSDDSMDVTQFTVSRQGAVVYMAEAASVLPELWAEGKPVSHFNDGFANISLQKAELFRYQSFDGTPIEAALFRGAGTRDGEPAPMIAMIHGGASGAWRNRFEVLTQLLVARG